MSNKKFLIQQQDQTNAQEYDIKQFISQQIHSEQDKYKLLYDEYGSKVSQFKCECDFCNRNDLNKKIPTYLFIDNEFLNEDNLYDESQLKQNVQKRKTNFKDAYHHSDNDYNTDFNFLIKKLNPKQGNFPFKFYIQDTFVYQNGELKVFVYNNKDDNVIFYNDKISHQKIQKIVTNRLYQSNQQLQKKLMKIQQIKKNNDKNYMLLQFQKQLDQFHEENQFIQSVLIKNIQELTQIEFQKMLKYRSIHPIWHQVFFVQTLIQNDNHIKNQKFIYERDSKTSLYNQVLEEVVYIYAQHMNNDQFDIPSKQFNIEQDQIQQENYLQYITYKLIIFIEIQCQIRINRVMFQFKKDNNNNYNLINCTHLIFEEIAQQIQYDQFMKTTDLFKMKEDQQINLDKEQSEKCKKTFKIFADCYNDIKNNMDIDLNPPEFKEPISNKIFSILNPKIKESLTDIIKNKDYELLLQNFPKEQKKYTHAKQINTNEVMMPKKQYSIPQDQFQIKIKKKFNLTDLQNIRKKRNTLEKNSIASSLLPVQKYKFKDGFFNNKSVQQVFKIDFVSPKKQSHNIKIANNQMIKISQYRQEIKKDSPKKEFFFTKQQ